MDVSLNNQLADLLRITAENHHLAFAETDGKDDDWAIWYADKMHTHLTEQFGFAMSKAELIECLIKAELEHRVRAPDSDWPVFYAEMFMEHRSPSSDVADKLSLYYFNGCPFCMMVLGVINGLNVEIELRDIFDGAKHRDDLVAARGRGTVPVLLIEGSDGTTRWMPESRDIARYLQSNYGTKQ